MYVLLSPYHKCAAIIEDEFVFSVEIEREVSSAQCATPATSVGDKHAGR